MSNEPERGQKVAVANPFGLQRAKPRHLRCRSFSDRKSTTNARLMNFRDGGELPDAKKGFTERRARA